MSFTYQTGLLDSPSLGCETW